MEIIGKSIKFIDDGSDVDKETAADLFARDRLLSPESYASFIQKRRLYILKQSVVMHGLRM